MQINRTRILLVVAGVVAALVLVLTWFVGVGPQLSNLNDSAQQYQQTKQQNDAEQIKVARLKAQYATLDQLKTQLSDLQQGVPVTLDEPGLVRQLNSAAGASGASATGLTLDDATLYAAPSWYKAPDTGGRLAGVGLTVTATGTDAQLRQFVRQVQRMPRYYTVSDVKYDAGDQSGEKVTITGTAWVMISAAAAQKAAASASPSASASASASPSN